ncbi:mitochondrial transcription termination factorfamily protein [Striga asiatica]|uniref:Mitochondrial transcription termination factorfamily protein n=1 Tax=Striga asiatica TaxID=4170 RepID=A0A5A7PRG0_STRAF|nr:mitochondrial transcription termination factorfamily protein [Striga asiatica]
MILGFVNQSSHSRPALGHEALIPSSSTPYKYTMPPPNLPALLRTILSRPCPNQFAKFCTLKNAGPGENSPENGPVVSYLVDSCGLSPEDAIAASKKVHFGTPVKPNAFLDLLKNEGFTKPQISSIVRAKPRLLLSKPENSILPKIQFFQSSFSGVPKKDVLATISKYPFLLTMSLEQKLAPNLDYLKNLLGPEKAAALFARGSHFLTWASNQNRFISNVDHLREIGVPTSQLERAFFLCPGIFSLEHSEFRKLVQEVREMGFNPSRLIFFLAINARSGKSCLALWNRCYEVYRKWGWSRDDILGAFLKHPNCMLCSEKKITAFFEFVSRELGRDAKSVAKKPTIIFFSMEKRIVPRCTFVRDLASKGLIKEDWNLNKVLVISEKDFIESYVLPFAGEAQELCETYASRKAEAGENVSFVKLMYKLS